MVQLCHCDSRAALSLAESPAAAGDDEAAEALRRPLEAAVHTLLLGVGEDPTREGLMDTPRRVAKAWLDMTRGYRQECKSAFGTALFHEPVVAAGSDGLVIVRDITFAALSEESLLPFHGRCHIAYVPARGVVLGLSKLARVTKCLAARLQTQQQFAERLVAAVGEEVCAHGVAAVVQAVHLGQGPAPAARLASAASGCFQDPACGHLSEFLALLRLGGRAAPGADGFGAAAAAPAAEQQQPEQQQQQQQPEQQQPEQPGTAARPAMVAAADALLLSVGEDPSRKGLVGGAARYVSWLQSATAGYHMRLPCSGGGGEAAELGPPTPDDHSPDPSDASSDDMSAELPCILGMAEAQPEAQQQQQQQQPAEQQQAQQAQQADGLQSFSTHFSSQCEHHLLPFYGRIKLAYLPASSSVGGGGGGGGSLNPAAARAQLAHIVAMYSRRLQVQERITHQVADAVVAALGARAVLVVVESAHMCMVARGVEKHASTTLTTAARGAWAADAAARGAALQALLDEHPRLH